MPEYEALIKKPSKTVNKYLDRLERRTGVKFHHPVQTKGPKANPNLLIMNTNKDNVLLFNRRRPQKDVVKTDDFICKIFMIDLCYN